MLTMVSEMLVKSREPGDSQPRAAPKAAPSAEESSKKQKGSTTRAERTRSTVTAPVLSGSAVVFIAPTQHGKSTTIQVIYEMMGSPDDMPDKKKLVIGNGTMSATKGIVVLPEVRLSYLTYTPWPPDVESSRRLMAYGSTLDAYLKTKDKALMTKEVADGLYELRREAVEGSTYKANVQQGMMATSSTNTDEMGIKLRMVDTPGLDDSDGKYKDDETIEALLKNFVDHPELKSLGAFVFVVKGDIAFSNAFLTSALRYWDQFPNCRQNWIFIHTSLNAFAESFPGQARCYEQACSHRKKALTNALMEKFKEDKHLVPMIPHIFIENVGLMYSRRAKRSPVAEFQQRERAQSLNSFVTALCSVDAVKMNYLTYQKSTVHKTIDEKTIAMFNLRASLVAERTLSLIPEEADRSKMIRFVMLGDEIGEFEEQILAYRDQLAKMDSNKTEIRASRWARSAWNMSNGQTYTLEVPYPEEAVRTKITKTPSFEESSITEETLRYDAARGVTVWSVTCNAPPGRGFEFLLRIRVMKKYIHQEAIKDLNEKIIETQKKLEAAHQEVAEMSDLVKRVQKEQTEEFWRGALELALFLRCSRLAANEKPDLEKWQELSHFYLWAQSEEGQAAFADPNRSNLILEKFCQAEGIDEWRQQLGLTADAPNQVPAAVIPSSLSAASIKAAAVRKHSGLPEK